MRVSARRQYSRTARGLQAEMLASGAGSGTLHRGVDGVAPLESGEMSIALWSLVAVYGLVVFLWLAATIWLRGFHGDEALRIAPRPEDRPDPRSPSLAVYVAAHNEEDRIATCLKRLLEQNYGNLRVVVINDRSEDATSQRVADLMRREPRIELVEIDDLPRGWIGKTHALATACAGAKADYLLFIDCDCRLVPGAIAGVMKKVREEALDFLSLWPRLDLASPAERILTPAVTWLLGLWTILGSKGAADGSQVVLGNGQFMLFSRRAYERIGGHAAVRAELAEDIVMARKVGELGLKRWVGWGKGLYASTRANDFRRAVNATTRIVIGSLLAPWRVFVSAHLVSGGLASPLYVGLPALAWAAFQPEILPLWGIVGMAILHLAAMRVLTRRVFSVTFERTPSILHIAFGGLVCTFVMLRAYWVITGRGRVQWGTTSYRVQGSRIIEALTAP